MNTPCVKKYLRIILLIGIMSGSAFTYMQPVEAVTLSDIGLSSDYARASILSLAEKNIINGDPAGNFMPHSAVTRSRMVVMLVKALGIDTVNIPGTPTFKDVPKGHWAYKYVEAAYREGIITGLSKDTFGLDEKCTREQVAAIISRSFKLSGLVQKTETDYSIVDKLKDKSLISGWSRDAVEFSISNGLMKGTGDCLFDPKSTAEMEQAAVIIDRVISSKESIESSISSAVSKNATDRTIGINLNNDLLYTDFIVKQGELFIPAQIFKYLESEVSMNDKTGLIMIEKARTPDNKSGNLLFQVGNTLAYKNYTGAVDPFQSPENIDSKTISLSSAPIMQDNEIFIPAMDFSYNLGIDAHYNSISNVLVMEDKSSGTAKNPYLYSVIRNSTYYNGSFNLNFMMEMDNKKTNASLDLDYKVSGLKADENTDMKSSFLSKINYSDAFYNQTINKQYDIHKTADNYTVQTSGGTEEKPLYALRNSGALVSDLNDISNKNGNLLNLLYRNSPEVEQTNNVSINGVSASRFVITLKDMDSIKTFLGTDYFPEIEPLSAFYIAKSEYESDGYVISYNKHPSTIGKVMIEIFVGRDNRIISQRIKYDGIRSVFYTTSYPLTTPSDDDPEEVSFSPMLHLKNRVIDFHVSYDINYLTS